MEAEEGLVDLTDDAVLNKLLTLIKTNEKGIKMQISVQALKVLCAAANKDDQSAINKMKELGIFQDFLDNIYLPASTPCSGSEE